MDEKEIVPEEKRKSGARLQKRNGSRVRKVLLGFVLILAIGFGAVCAIANINTRIYSGITVLGQDLGGMSAAQAEKKLSETIESSPKDAGIKFVADRGSAYLSFSQLGIAFDPEETAQSAYDYCHGGNALHSGWLYLRGLFSEIEVQPVCSYDEKTTEHRAEQLARKLSQKAIGFSETAQEDGLHLTKQRDERTVEAAEVLAAITNNDLFCTTGESVAEIPFTITEMPAGDLATIAEKYATEAVNAGYDKENECIIPEQIHVDFDVSQAKNLLDAAQGGETVIVGTATLPKVTAAELEKVLFRDELGTYTTKVGGAEGRHKNVQNTANKINGVILNSGESLKYSELIMPFTEENGYFPAPGYLKGKTVDMIGGGACQASSTLYAASLYANLEIVQRRNHGFASDYIGLGLDATVAEGGPEFEVRNNTDYPIKVDAQFYTKNKKDYITVSVIGTKVDDTYVKIRTEQLSSTPYEEEIIETDELAPGVREVEQTAYTGYDVKTYRQIYSGDGTLISETLEAHSKYNARNRIIKVGKAVQETVVETPTEVTPTEETVAEETPPELAPEGFVKPELPETQE